MHLVFFWKKGYIWRADISSSVECNMPVTLGIYRRDKLIGAAIETTRGR